VIGTDAGTRGRLRAAHPLHGFDGSSIPAAASRTISGTRATPSGRHRSRFSWSLRIRTKANRRSDPSLVAPSSGEASIIPLPHQFRQLLRTCRTYEVCTFRVDAVLGI
jgi:hypothetical protein